ncbi:histidine triad nucleotide-binding protein [Paenibacillus cisolokensis]|jgi:histidine triad (HIT) family protein|uniref:Histidine triad nucleotide-binding protein n=1 Tax=Paenibacillus cisolokensis TaxID=1658519 RepID=A0ABQ4NAY1_9BACL|nr:MULTISPECIES: histidine triad nucleotide-binding protein [Paenibacillus]ALS27292.1 hydrolase [Paenibacillus sp. 32O-W]GIQ65330.1 histidine triad nucleotide-binding protein [Paenibacillus cisolokensis]
MECVFCKIVKGELPSRKVYESENVVAFHDIQPQAPVHIVIIPKKHIPTMNDVGAEDDAVVAEIFAAARQIAAEQGIDASGYRLINNCNADGGQVVYHLHIHLLGGRKLGALVADSAS